MPNDDVCKSKNYRYVSLHGVGLLVLLGLVLVDLVTDPLQGHVELLLHPVHILTIEVSHC